MHKRSKTDGTIDPIEDRRTRGDSKVKFDIKNFKYKTMQRSPLFRGVWEWDELTPDIQKTEDKTCFKNKIRGKTHRIALI